MRKTYLLILYFCIIIFSLCYTKPVYAGARYTYVSLRDISNLELHNDYLDHPVGKISLNNIPFDIPVSGNNFFASHNIACESCPKEFRITNLQIHSPKTVWMLVNSSDSFLRFFNQNFAYVTIIFSDDSKFVYDFIVGRNVREWLQSGLYGQTVNTVNNANSTEAWRGVRPITQESPVITDLLKIDLPQQYADKVIKEIVLVDDSENRVTVPNPKDPGIIVKGITIEQLSPEHTVDLQTNSQQLPFDRTAELTATVRDGNGNVVANKLVEFSAIEGRADFTPGSMMTDAQGRAKTVVTPNSLNNLRVSAEVEGITGEFAFEVYRPKILIIPGHGASYNSLEVMTGIESENWHWFTDVSRRSWDDVVSVLREAGLQEGRDFEFVFYDWRKSLIPQDDLVSARDRFLIPKLDQMLSGQPGGRKVNILAHSFGGLVTRSLVEQSERASKINRIITFGTPHRGASNAYYGWEGGKAAPIGDAFYRSSVFAVNHLAHKLVGYPTRAAAMRKTMPSVAELLPEYSPYVYRMDNNIFLNTSNLVLARNPLIDEVLKMDRFKNSVGDFGIIYRAVVSDSNETIYDVKVKPHLFPNEWEDGYAHDYGLKNGDNTVPISSADLGDGYSYFQKGAHADLPDEAVGFVKEQFRIAAVAPAVGRTAPRRVMGVLMFSPAYAEIYNSAGEKISESFPLDTDNHNFVYASDFADGIVTIRVTGTANGSYQTYINFADDGVYKELELSGTITQGKVKLYEFLVDTNQENFSELVETTLHTIPGALVIRGSNLLTTLRFEVPRDFQTEQLQKEWVRVNGKELAIKEVEITRNNKHVLVKVATIDLLRLLQTPKTRMDLTATLFGETQSLRGKRSLIVQR